jgi:tRNA A37 threonylcarbamoyladenosine dehydratase
LLGKAKMKRLRKSFVVVAGLGAVGSYVVEALARAGVGRLRLVDFDKINWSNINRNLFALGSTAGCSKAHVAADRVKDINPSCRVETLEAFVAEESLDEVLRGQPDLVIDAIDSLNPKVQFLAGLYRRGIPVIAAMGAAARTDPFSVKAGDLFSVEGCPLARRVRKRLRKAGISGGIMCVYSDQIQRVPTGAVSTREIRRERGRPRPAIGSLPTLPGLFGLIMAHLAIERLCGGWGTSS